MEATKNTINAPCSGLSLLTLGLGICCPDCLGSGKKELCDECENRGWIDDPDGGTMVCDDCKGEAGEDCEKCAGEGTIYP